VATYAQIADLPLTIDGYALEARAVAVSSGFLRRTTTIHLTGAGETGVGEDVTYDPEDAEALQAAGTTLPLSGETTIARFSRQLDELDLFPQAPQRPASVDYRRWAFESAALDLALRQAGRSLADVLGRTPRPVSFVVSTRLGDPPTMAPLERLLAAYPKTRLKLDVQPGWDASLMGALVATGAVEAVDFKGYYDDPRVPAATVELYREVAETFTDAWLEDPKLTPEAAAALASHHDRITWDAPIHSVADVEALPFAPRTVNVKPSRFGSLEALFAIYDYLAERDIGAYGGGQFELGPGRGQIQALAALFHPDATNDIAPSGYNDPELPAGLPTSPLEPRLLAVGFGWES